MTEYRTAVYKTQLLPRTKTTIRRAFILFDRGQDTRFLDSLSRIQDLNAPVYACAYLIIYDKIEETPESINKSELFNTLVQKLGDYNGKKRLALLFQVYVTIVLIRLQVPEAELSLKEGQRKYLSTEEDDGIVYDGY